MRLIPIPRFWAVAARDAEIVCGQNRFKRYRCRRKQNEAELYRIPILASFRRHGIYICPGAIDALCASDPEPSVSEYLDPFTIVFLGMLILLALLRKQPDD